MLKRFGAAAALLGASVLMAVSVTGCSPSKNDVDSSKSDQNSEAQIQAIQNNKNMPQPAKNAAIAQIKARQSKAAEQGKR